jgi:hypothetical protein
MSASKRAGHKDNENTSPIHCYLLRNIYFPDPSNTSNTPNTSNTSKLYASISILDPIITIERHHQKYHVAARFNIETTILNYENRTRSALSKPL